METEGRTVGPRGWEKWHWGVIVEWGWSFSVASEKVLEMDGGDGGTTLGTSLMPLNCTLTKG